MFVVVKLPRSRRRKRSKRRSRRRRRRPSPSPLQSVVSQGSQSRSQRRSNTIVTPL
jgi:hypothetical protein